MNVAIREMREKDFSRAFFLNFQDWETTHTRRGKDKIRGSYEYFSGISKRMNGGGLAAVVLNNTVGYAVYSVNQDYEDGEGAEIMFISDLSVQKHFRRHCIGKKLVHAVAEQAYFKGINIMKVYLPEDNEAQAKSFYEALGFLPGNEEHSMVYLGIKILLALS